MRSPLAFTLAMALTTASPAAAEDLDLVADAAYSSIDRHDMTKLKDVDYSRKHVTVEVAWESGSEARSLKRDGGEILKKAKAFFERYNIDVGFTPARGLHRDSHVIGVNFISEDTLARNTPLDPRSIIGTAEYSKRTAFIKTTGAREHRKRNPREMIVNYYANVIAHEMAHLFSLLDENLLNGGCYTSGYDSIMDSDRFRSIETGSRQSHLTGEQEAQMHDYLSCGQVFELNEERYQFQEGMKAARERQRAREETDNRRTAE